MNDGTPRRAVRGMELMRKTGPGKNRRQVDPNTCFIPKPRSWILGLKKVLLIVCLLCLCALALPSPGRASFPNDLFAAAKPTQQETDSFQQKLNRQIEITTRL